MEQSFDDGLGADADPPQEEEPSLEQAETSLLGGAMLRYSGWKYHLPHDWDTERARWEDVYLMPDDPSYSGESIWLTVDAVDIPLETFYKEWMVDENGDSRIPGGKDAAEDDYAQTQRLLGLMGEEDFYIDEEENMSVRSLDFSKKELIEWTNIYLQEKGIEYPILREAPIEDFAGSNGHAVNVEIAKERFEDYKKREGVEEDGS